MSMFYQNYFIGEVESIFFFLCFLILPDDFSRVIIFIGKSNIPEKNLPQNRIGTTNYKCYF